MWGMRMIYERDLIAERDSWQKMKSTVIKWWQVNYIMDDSVIDPNVNSKGQDTSQDVSDGEFNASTGSYSGAYGKVVTLDQGGLDQVASILNEKSDMIHQMFLNNE